MNIFHRFFFSPVQLMERGCNLIYGLQGCPVDHKLAREYLALAAKRGDMDAERIRGRTFVPGTHELTERIKKGFESVRRLRLAAEAGDPDACYFLGKLKLTDEVSDYVYRRSLELVKRAADNGHARAMYAYGMELMKSERIEHDRDTAARYFTRAAELDHIDSVQALFAVGEEELGMRHLCRLAQAENPEAMCMLASDKIEAGEDAAAMALYERAAELGFAGAMYNLGVCYEYGEIVDQDLYKAAAWYRKAIDAGETAAIIKYARLLAYGPEEMRDERSAFEWFMKGVDAGNPEAMQEVATCYKYGAGVEQSAEMAEKYYLKLVGAGYPGPGFVELFRLYADGEATAPDNEKALVCLQKSIDAGFPEAFFFMALVCREACAGKSPSDEVEWMRKAADAGHIQAIYEMGNYYFRGVLVEPDPDKAFECFSRVAQQLPEATDRLGQCYSNGIGCEKDLAKAFECYRKAAEAGCAEAMFDMGVCYRFGEGVPVDIPKAVEWYSKAVEHGFTPAMVNLGFLYLNGLGVPQDLPKAFDLFRQAAHAGHRDGQFLLGYMYFHGRYVERDYAKAARWFEQGAAQGEPDSMYHLALCYNDGLGVPRDLHKATEWLFRAADLGWEDARRLIKRLQLTRPAKKS